MRKLWLDDVRDPPDGTWSWARTAQECIERLQASRWDMLSLDHDLGERNGSGYLVAAYIEFEAHDLKRSHYDQLPDIVFIHSANPVGAKNMGDGLKAAGYSELVKNEYYMKSVR